MSEENVDKLKEQIKRLQEQLNEAKADNSFEELKKKYEKVIDDKNKEINELMKTNELIKERMNNTVNNLNDEVKMKLEQSEQLAELNKQVEELLTDKAEATVDTFIQQGKILPAQRETALKLCLNDNDTFLDLYKDAQPIIDTGSKPKSKKVNPDMNRLVDYFKN
jgi:DNA repair exonuclease SbcCD ATPase subunit